MADLTEDKLGGILPSEHTDGEEVVASEASEQNLQEPRPDNSENTSDEANVDVKSEIEIADSDEAKVADVKSEAENSDGNDGGKKKVKLPAFLQKFIAYLNAHEDVRQMVFFLMFSVICGASQMIVTYALSAGLKLEAHLGSTRLDWFVFHYATQAEFIGFLVGSVVGQVLTFVLNRKKTFNVPDYVALRAVMYAIMAVLIIIMQTALGGAVTDACWAAKPDANGFLDLLFNLTGQAVAGIAAVIVNFLGNKFFVMRDWGKKKREAAAKANAENSDTADQADVAEQCDMTEQAANGITIVQQAASETAVAEQDGAPAFEAAADDIAENR